MIRILVWLALMLTSLCGISVGHCQDSIRITNGEWGPYFSEKLEHNGIGSRIVSEAFAQENVAVEYGFFPWKRAMYLAREGVWDGVVGFDVNEERKRDFYVSDPIWESEWVFFQLKGRSFVWNKLGDLCNVSIGGVIEYMYTQEFLAAEQSKAISVFRAPSDYLGYKMLLNGHVQLFPQLREVGWFQLRKLFSPADVAKITVQDKPFGKHISYLLLSKKNPGNEHLMEIFNSGLRKIKQNGKLEQYFHSFDTP